MSSTWKILFLKWDYETDCFRFLRTLSSLECEILCSVYFQLRPFWHPVKAPRQENHQKQNIIGSRKSFDLNRISARNRWKTHKWVIFFFTHVMQNDWWSWRSVSCCKRERERAETNKHLTIYFEEIVKKSFNRICASTIAGRKKPQTVSNVR